MKYPKIRIEEDRGFLDVKNQDIVNIKPGYDYHEERKDGELKDRAMWLCSDFDWHIVEDRAGCLCLIAVRKK